MATEPTAAVESSAWDEYVIGEPMSVLEEAVRFVVVAWRLRHGVSTEFGERSAFDVTVATTVPGVYRTASGFAAGIVGQIRRAAASDLPAVCELAERDTGKASPTKILRLVSRLERGISPEQLTVIAAALPHPLHPVAAAEASGDEIPF